jgi:DNA invertase Pin-like site-specific DNA recombinase
MKAIAYLRELPAPTLEQQQRAFLDHCARGGLEVGPTFTETQDGSAAPQFLRMLELMRREQRSFTVVVVAALSVFGPRVREQARRYLQLAALGLPLQLAGGRDPDEALMDAWAARGPGERRRERVREAMRTRALRGEVLGRPPYGYRTSNRRLDVNEVEATVVREIFRACLEEGEGVRRIARRLNDAGFRTRRGGPWSMVSVRDILRNPVYVGTYRRLGVLVPRAHEPIVDRQSFDGVQRLLAERRTSPSRQRRREYLLAGLAYCGHCGNRLIGVRRPRRGVVSGEGDAGSGEYVYYQCQSRTNQSRCGYHTRRAAELEAIVRERVAGASAEDDTDTAVAVESEAARARRSAAGGRARRRELDRMLERRASGEWTAGRLRSEAAALVLRDLEEEQELLQQSGRLPSTAADHSAGRMAARVRLAEHWDEFEFDERRALLREVVASVVATDDGVHVKFLA